MHRTAFLLALLGGLGLGSARAQEQQVASPHVNLHGLACSACHTTSSWTDVVFDHRRTGTPLRGQHTVAPCTGCHDLRDFRTVAQPCRFCHQDPHRGDAGPNCRQCHEETTWHQVNARDAHANTRLPELGVHASLRCVDCHRQAAFQQFSGAVTPCEACHQGTFDATTSPSHAALSFSRQCESCHQLTTWDFALYKQHDAIFGIYTGPHAGVWRNCASCHPNAADFTAFSCTTCHLEPRTDGQHQGIPGYTYQSSACLMCHPNAARGSFTQHDAIFPIFSGVHAGTWTTCAACHTDPNNSQVFTCMSSGCHAQAQTDPIHAGITGYTYVASQCLSCHPAGTQANFPQHDQLYFPIYTGTHAGLWPACATCHTSAGDPSVFTCMASGCHVQAQTDQIHAGVTGYSYVASQCLSCHPMGRSGD